MTDNKIIGNPVELPNATAATAPRLKSSGQSMFLTMTVPRATPNPTTSAGMKSKTQDSPRVSLSGSHRAQPWTSSGLLPSSPHCGHHSMRVNNSAGIVTFIDIADNCFLASDVMIPVLVNQIPTPAITKTTPTDPNVETNNSHTRSVSTR